MAQMETVVPMEGGVVVRRLRVPGGWLYVTTAFPRLLAGAPTPQSPPTIATAFVPDLPAHDACQGNADDREALPEGQG